jgi:HTH-like domain
MSFRRKQPDLGSFSGSGDVLRQGVDVKYAFIERNRHHWPVSVLCEVLEVSPSGHHQRRQRTAQAKPHRSRVSDDALLANIKAIHAQVKGEYGWPRMWKELLALGVRVGKERVRKQMAQHGIRARHKRKYIATTNSNHDLPVAPNLLARNFTVTAPNRTKSGRAILPIWRQPKAGYTSRSSSTCSAGRWWAGRCSRT